PSLMNLWLTPHGFLLFAERHGAAAVRSGEGWQVSFEYEEGSVRYPVSGEYDAEGRLLRTRTRIDDSVFGDMLVENRFGDYRNFGTVVYPASIEQWQGGYPVLHLDVTAVTADADTGIP